MGGGARGLGARETCDRGRAQEADVCGRNRCCSESPGEPAVWAPGRDDGRGPCHGPVGPERARRPIGTRGVLDAQSADVRSFEPPLPTGLRRIRASSAYTQDCEWLRLWIALKCTSWQRLRLRKHSWVFPSTIDVLWVTRGVIVSARHSSSRAPHKRYWQPPSLHGFRSCRFPQLSRHPPDADAADVGHGHERYAYAGYAHGDGDAHADVRRRGYGDASLATISPFHGAAVRLSTAIAEQQARLTAVPAALAQFIADDGGTWPANKPQLGSRQSHVTGAWFIIVGARAFGPSL